MGRVPWCGDEVYEAARAFAERCLLHDDSLFTPGRPVATLENAQALQQTVGVENLGPGTFAGKLVRQLDGVEPDAIQLCAELLFFQLLGENDAGGAKKAEHVETVLALVPGAPALAPELRAALDAGGTASYGIAKNRRDAYIRCLIRLFVNLKQREDEERAALLRDPWSFREVVGAERTNPDGMQANAVLHLIFPDAFSAVVSGSHRTTLLRAFARAPGVDPAANDDRRIAHVRTVVDEQLGRSVDFYEPPFSRVWRGESDPGWEEVVDWAEDFLSIALTEALRARGATVERQQTGRHLDAERLIPLRPDITVWRGGRCVAVVDAKYKRLADERFPNADAYQMLAYCTAYGLARGTLVYAHDPTEEHRSHHLVDGRTTIEVRTVDVTREPAAVLREVERLAAALVAADRGPA